MPLDRSEQYTLTPKADYGNGAAIRSIVITRPAPGQIAVALEDMAHAFSIDFTHNETHITSVDAKWERHPMTTCPGASHQLKLMVGCPLSGDLSSLRAFTDTRSHCTHMYDATALAIVHAYQQRSDCRYDVVIPDAIGGKVTAQLRLNGKLAMSMQLQDYDFILSPPRFAGRSIFKGFLKWARKELNDEQFEHCFLLQKTLFVSGSQQEDHSANYGKSARQVGLPRGACFASQPSLYNEAKIGFDIRQFGKKPEEQVLNFFKHDMPDTDPRV